MNLRSVAVLACRILAIVALISALQSSIYVTSTFYDAIRETGLDYMEIRVNPWEILLTQGAPCFLLIALACFLWFRAEWLSKRMISSRDPAIRPDILVNPQVQALAFACVGLYVLVAALGRAAQMMVIFVASEHQDPIMRSEANGILIADFVIIFFQMALGLWLFSGAGVLVRGFDYLRRAGRDAELLREETDEDTIPVRPEK